SSMAELTDQLATEVAKKLRAFGYSRPSQPVLRSLLATMYLATLRTEEGRFVRGSVTFASWKKPEIDPPFTRRADYPAFSRLTKRLPLSLETLVKLARAIDKWAGSIAVFGTNKSNVMIWGVIDQLVQQNVRLNREAN